MQCSRRLLLAAVLAGHATCTSIRELHWYNSTATITAHFRRLAADHCGTRLRLNPELDGTVDWEGNAIQGALFTDGVRHEQNILRASKRRFLINFATHGRDYALPDLALRLAHALCDGSNRSKAILDHSDILLVPILNVPGRLRVETALGASSCGDLRKNRNLVDIDSNFAPNWVFGDDNPNGVDFRGPLAASEPETKLIMALQLAWQPHVFIDVQSNNNVALSYAQWSSFTDVTNHDALASVMHAVRDGSPGLCNHTAAVEGTNECPVVAAASKAMRPPYKADGTALDWFYGADVTHSFLFSTFSGSEQPDSVAAPAGLAAGATNLMAVGEHGGSSGAAASADSRGGIALSRREQQQQALQRKQQLLLQRAAQQGSGAAKAAPQAPGALRTLPEGAVSLVATGEQANGALYDPIYDCIKYFAPITEAGFEAMVARWVPAFLATAEHYVALDAELAVQVARKEAELEALGLTTGRQGTGLSREERLAQLRAAISTSMSSTSLLAKAPHVAAAAAHSAAEEYHRKFFEKHA